MSEADRARVETVLQSLEVLSKDRQGRREVLEEFARSVRAETLRDASKLLIRHKHELTVDEMLGMIDALGDDADGP